MRDRQTQSPRGALNVGPCERVSKAQNRPGFQRFDGKYLSLALRPRFRRLWPLFGDWLRS